MDLGELTLATFEPLVGDRFAVDGAAADLALVLHSATAAGEWPGGRDPFSLVFVGPGEPLLAQAIYALRHAELGRLEIFLVPVARDGAGVRYEAVFT